MQADNISDKTGVTLIELVITMVLIGIVAFIVADVLSTGLEGFLMTDNRKEATDQARIAMERITREIRNVRSSSDVDTVSASTTQFCFINTDGSVISFRYPGLSANTIARQDALASLAACPGAAGSDLAANIVSFSFGYIRGDNGNVENTFSAANTKRIRITITSTVSGESVQLQSEVWPRSL